MPGKGRKRTTTPVASKRSRMEDIANTSGFSQDKVEVSAAMTSPEKESPQRVQPEEPRASAASSSRPLRDGQMPAGIKIPPGYTEKRRLVVRLVRLSFGVGTHDVPGSHGCGK